MNAVTLFGVTLGNDIAVGAGAVVTKSFRGGYCVLTAVPATVKRHPCVPRLDWPCREEGGWLLPGHWGCLDPSHWQTELPQASRPDRTETP
jgi:hypothetical protein